MSLLVVRDEEVDPQFSCPSGGTWYACDSGSHSVGCCASDPCQNSCSAGNIRPGSFNVTAYGKFADAECPAGSSFYTCDLAWANEEPFWGCCKSNPCSNGGCPDGDLTGAYLASPAQREAYLPKETTESEKKTNVGAIAGGVVGGVVGILLIVAVVIFIILKRRKARSAAEPEAGQPSTRNEKGYYHDAPPGYSSPLAQQQEFPHMAQTPVQLHDNFINELPAETVAPKQQRLSELPGTNHRMSELESPVPGRDRDSSGWMPGGAQGV
ncbi:hypothetical protein CC78DRAFT_12277 [Lojkania enalia]|uniref:Uncharacterized protein n=1 Tax=Lojkania enalia TaxID=147567 RepID=A0A9P4TRN6_9PLEO|nr:hypothetical protein CC78DRAFT_12277 [Didymosphaeria enalia]